jgi:hypothetical protein
MNHNLSDKSLICLLIADAHGSDQWNERYHRACEKFGEKVVNKKMDDLCRRGYIECGVSSVTGWLTEKGRAALNPHVESVRLLCGIIDEVVMELMNK